MIFFSFFALTYGLVLFVFKQSTVSRHTVCAWTASFLPFSCSFIITIIGDHRIISNSRKNETNRKKTLLFVPIEIYHRLRAESKLSKIHAVLSLKKAEFFRFFFLRFESSFTTHSTLLQIVV